MRACSARTLVRLLTQTVLCSSSCRTVYGRLVQSISTTKTTNNNIERFWIELIRIACRFTVVTRLDSLAQSIVGMTALGVVVDPSIRSTLDRSARDTKVNKERGKEAEKRISTEERTRQMQGKWLLIEGHVCPVPVGVAVAAAVQVAAAAAVPPAAAAAAAAPSSPWQLFRSGRRQSPASLFAVRSVGPRFRAAGSSHLPLLAELFVAHAKLWAGLAGVDVASLHLEDFCYIALNSDTGECVGTCPDAAYRPSGDKASVCVVCVCLCAHLACTCLPHHT